MMTIQDTSFHEKTQTAERLLKQLANANRLMILCSLISGEKNAKTLMEITGLNQSAVSQHLTKLKEDNLISYRKEGRNAFYQLSNMNVIALISTLHLIFCKD